VNYMNPITNVRTFGSDPEKVLKNARAFTHILQESGIAASCKHFPGDGVDYRDQHLHPSWNTLSAEEWFASYGRIYEELIRDGLMSIMAGHIVQPNVIRAVDPSAGGEDMLPGSQSRQMLTGVLRERYGFNGVIITDATIMGGYTMSMARSEAIPRTLAAGCDMFCFGTDIFEDITYLMEAVEDGRVSAERLDEAVTRVLAMKAALAAKEKALQEEREQLGENSALGRLALTDAETEQKRCAEAAVTLVKNKGNIVPVSPEWYPRIRLAVLGSDDTFDGSLRQMAGDFLRGRGFEVEDYDPMEDDLHGTRVIPDDRLYLILCNMPAASNQTTVRISWCPKHAMEIPRFVNEEASVFISFANPYHLQDIPRVRTYINAYTATRATVEAALGKLTGTGSFTGVSPVDPFCGLPDTRL
ncbi:MAG: glycosyl hydrolase family 3, partial [Lachnospiraceae bacterium]|nr:glycosyl hydrolase family 3 [Lachnospiraceae bacterium]